MEALFRTGPTLGPGLWLWAKAGSSSSYETFFDRSIFLCIFDHPLIFYCDIVKDSSTDNRGRRGTEVAFAFFAQQLQVRISAFLFEISSIFYAYYHTSIHMILRMILLHVIINTIFYYDYVHEC